MYALRHLWFVAALLMACEGRVGDGDGVVNEAEVPQVGWQADFDGRAHEVSGWVELVDERTLRVHDFTYDGGGVDARFYLVVDGAPFDARFELTDNQVGISRDDETFDLTIPDDVPEGAWDTLTLWCVAFGADFGHATLLPPG